MDYEVPEPLKPYVLPFAERAEIFVPELEDDINAARMEIEPVQYLGYSLFKAFQATASLVAAAVAFGIILSNNLFMVWGPVVSLVIGFFAFITIAYRPRIKARRIAREVEEDLPYAMRHMLIEVSSGISLYEAMVSVTDDYGKASDEFEEIVSDIQGGTPQIEAIENSIARTKSSTYRKSMWQIINALKSGANVTVTLESLVDTIFEEQKLEVKNYGEDLNPFVLMYLMLAVIFPSLGVTLMIVLSSFTGFAIGQNLFMGLLIGLILFQMFFLNMIKSRRPEVKAA